MKFNSLIIGILLGLLCSNASAQGPTNYEKVVEILKGVAARNPENSRLFILGYSHSGQKIDGLEIGHGLVHHLIVGAHHGNEYGSAAVAAEFAVKLAQGPIPEQTVYVIPVLNIAGYNAGQEESRRKAEPGIPTAITPALAAAKALLN